MGYRLLKKRALGFTCRRCINEKYHLRLRGTHCFYLPFPGTCHHCGEIRNIVVDIRPFSLWRVVLARAKKEK